MIKTLFILGNHIQALGIVRQVKRIGLEVHLFTIDKYSITRFSNAVKSTFVFKDNRHLFDLLSNSIGAEKDTLLFPTNDSMVEFLSHNYEVLNPNFYLGIPDPETVNIFYNKRNTYQFAAKHNIPIPESWFPDTIDELQKLADKLNYPVIIKPAIMHTFHKTFGKKAFKCNNRDELIQVATMITTSFPMEHLVVQEFLSGGAKTLYSYGAFAANGKVIAALMANRIRQNPMDFGNSTTCAITCNVPRIQHCAEKILQLTNYFGLAEVEFMYDSKTDQYKFLEINTRAWKWHAISDGLGFAFIVKLINWMNNKDESVNKDFITQVAWIERLTDFAVIAKEVLKGNSILKEAYQSYRVKKITPVWSSADVLPFFMYLVLSPLLYIKRH